MLEVTYESVIDLEPGRLAAIDEDRGWIRVRLDKHAPLADVVAKLEVEINRVLDSARWFQLWRDEIVSSNTPDRPLRVRYIFDERTPNGVTFLEDRGVVKVYIDPSLNTEEFAAAINPVLSNFLAGGQWFQLFNGEIIDNGPGAMSRV